MMKFLSPIIFISILLSFLLVPLAGMGDEVEFVSTGEGDVSGSDAVIADDPYKGKEVKERDYEGHPLTQKSYDEECKDDLCKRAQERQLSGGTDWRDDEATGKTTKRHPKTEKSE